MSERTEQPTERRRQEARRRGQGVGRSHEFAMGLTLGVGVLALSALLPGMAASASSLMTSSIDGIDGRWGNAALAGHLGNGLLQGLGMILPLALLVLGSGVAGNLVSGGLVLSAEAVRFDPSRLNPFTGIRRLVDRQALVRLGLAALKLAILLVISWQILASRIPGIVASGGSDALTIARSALDAIFQLGLTITVLMAVVALIDFVVQRRKAMNQIKMTKDEVRREAKDMEGDPFIKAARRRRARQLAFARMMDAVPTADVVVTNPTHLAVALRYDSLTMRAPRIVAKGQRLMAARIKELARSNGVPVVEDRPLARALFSRPLGAEVPAHLYRAVARLLVIVHAARFGRGAPGRPQPGPSPTPSAGVPAWLIGQGRGISETINRLETGADR